MRKRGADPSQCSHCLFLFRYLVEGRKRGTSLFSTHSPVAQGNWLESVGFVESSERIREGERAGEMERDAEDMVGLGFQNCSSGNRVEAVSVPIKEQPTLWTFVIISLLDPAQHHLTISRGHTATTHLQEMSLDVEVCVSLRVFISKILRMIDESYFFFSFSNKNISNYCRLKERMNSLQIGSIPSSKVRRSSRRSRSSSIGKRLLPPLNRAASTRVTARLFKNIVCRLMPAAPTALRRASQTVPTVSLPMRSLHFSTQTQNSNRELRTN